MLIFFSTLLLDADTGGADGNGGESDGGSTKPEGSTPIPNIPPPQSPSTPIESGQLPEPPAPQASEPTEPDASESDEPEDQDEPPKTFDEEYVKKLRAENAKRRKELREAQEQLAKLQQDEQSAKSKKLKEQEKWRELAEGHEATIAEKDTAIEQLQKQILESVRASFIHAVASEMKAHDIRDANFGYMMDKDDLFDDNDDTTLQNLLSEFGQLKKTKPHLFQVEEPRQVQPDPSKQFGPAGPPKTVPQLQNFSPTAPTRTQKTDAERLASIRHRMGQNTTVFGRHKSF